MKKGSEMTVAEMVEKTKAGDRKAYAKLCKLVSEKIILKLEYLLKQGIDNKERLSQEVKELHSVAILKFCQRLRDFTYITEMGFYKWLNVLTEGVYVDYIRKLNKPTEKAVSLSSPIREGDDKSKLSDTIESKESNDFEYEYPDEIERARSLLKRAIYSLSHCERIIVVGRATGLKYKEILKKYKYDLTGDDLAKIYERAIKKLITMLKDRITPDMIKYLKEDASKWLEDILAK